MSTLIVESSRFGTLEIEAGAIIEFPTGLIGLGSRRWAVVGADPESAFQWLHSVDDPSLALPVTSPWAFFPEYEISLSDEDGDRIDAQRPEDIAVWVTVRAGSELADFSANLRAPIIVAKGEGHQVINEWPQAEVRAPLFPDAHAAAA